MRNHDDGGAPRWSAEQLEALWLLGEGPYADEEEDGEEGES